MAEKSFKQLYAIDEGLGRICNWVVAMVDNDLSKVLADDSFFAWTFKRERYEFEREFKTDETFKTPEEKFLKHPFSPFRIYHRKFAENSDDLIQNVTEHPDSLEWEGGWDGIDYDYLDACEDKPNYTRARLELSAWEDYWGTHGRKVALSLKQIRRIVKGEIKRVITNCYEDSDAKVGDSKEQEEYRKREMRFYQFRRDMMKRFPDAICSREDTKKFLEKWQGEHGEIYL